LVRKKWAASLDDAAQVTAGLGVLNAYVPITCPYNATPSQRSDVPFEMPKAPLL
jgi:hypothetical protein